jgi:hypothetical protein
MRGEITMLPTGLRRVLARVAVVAVAACALAACDKCGNSILHGNAGPLVCKGDQPK